MLQKTEPFHVRPISSTANGCRPTAADRMPPASRSTVPKSGKAETRRAIRGRYGIQDLAQDHRVVTLEALAELHTAMMDNQACG